MTYLVSTRMHSALRASGCLNSDTHRIVFITLATFLVITITCVARSSSHYESSRSVWATFINDSGWSSGGVAFLTGLVTPNYMYAGIDGALHLAEECINASVVVPRALMSTLIIGFVTSFCFVIAMLYCTNDLATIATSNTGYESFPPDGFADDCIVADNVSAFRSMRCGTKPLGLKRPLLSSSCCSAALLSSHLSVPNKLPLVLLGHWLETEPSSEVNG
jgi:hypothetical protein